MNENLSCQGNTTMELLSEYQETEEWHPADLSRVQKTENCSGFIFWKSLDSPQH